MSLAAVLEQLTAFATGADATPELLRAKAEFFSASGEVLEEERMYEARMAAFLDHFLLERPQGAPPRTPAERFLHERGPSLDERQREIAAGLTRTLHGLYEVLAISTGEVRVRDVLQGDKLRITERRHVAGLNRGDLFEARLIPVGEEYLFSPAFLFHPREARAAILREIKRRRRDGRKLGREFVWELARMALKTERYKKIPVEAIYSFERPSFPAHAPEPETPEHESE